MSDLNNEIQEVAEEVVKKSPQREILEWVVSIAVALVLALIIRQFVFKVVRVDGPSMEPTLHDGDRLIVWQLGYKPKNGDIIVLQKPGFAPYIKRVVATEGQTVDIDFNAGEVYVDGKKLEEDYIAEPTKLQGNTQFPVTVGANEVFVLGDNRNNSRDSRDITVGCVKRDEIMGKAIFRFWPFGDIKVF